MSKAGGWGLYRIPVEPNSPGSRYETPATQSRDCRTIDQVILAQLLKLLILIDLRSISTE